MHLSVVWHPSVSLACVGSTPPHRERTFNSEGMQKWMPMTVKVTVTGKPKEILKEVRVPSGADNGQQATSSDRQSRQAGRAGGRAGGRTSGRASGRTSGGAGG
jgi:hypothetical protein